MRWATRPEQPLRFSSAPGASAGRLLSINNYHYRRGGAEVVFLEQNRLFKALGWDVVPFCMHHPKNLPTPWSEFFVEETEFGRDYSFLQKANRAAKVIYSLEAQQKLRRLVAARPPDIAHAHNIYHHLSPAILSVLKGAGVPTILTLHDLKLACPAYTMLRDGRPCEQCQGGRVHNLLRHRCIKGSAALSAVVLAETVLHRLLGSYERHVDRFVVPSRFYIDKLVEWGWPRERFTYVPNFVDVEALKPSPGEEGGAAFLYVGRLSPEKGLRTLIAAAAGAGRPLHIAGSGPEETDLRRLAAGLGAEVRFLGHLGGEALHGAIGAARALVLPSEWYENAPMSVLEAYAVGRPVIVSRMGGLPELVREGETGWTFASGDADDLAAVLGRVAALPAAQIRRCGAAGRRWVEAEFSATR